QMKQESKRPAVVLSSSSVEPQRQRTVRQVRKQQLQSQFDIRLLRPPSCYLGSLARIGFGRKRSASVQVFGRRDDGLTTRSGGRRPKSARARNGGGCVAAVPRALWGFRPGFGLAGAASQEVPRLACGEVCSH